MEILKYEPCEEAVEYRKQYDTFKEAWDNCPRGDWMLWIARKVDVDLKTLTKAKALCALTVRHLMKDQRSKDACITALRFSRGKATRKELGDAADAAYTAAYTAAAAAAAYTAADAADAADAAAYAAYTAADAAYTAAYAAYTAADAADAADARIQNQQKTSDICRKVLTDAVFEKLGVSLDSQQADVINKTTKEIL